ncbi:MAG TPA: extracellular solute-binding protein [Xanthobacteraceae bacterium]|jgi:putative spermidine/putrescine transport system substrate-binding protein
MRTFFATALAVAAALGLAGGGAAAQGKLTISVWGGGYGETWKHEVLEPFVKKTGIDVTVDAGPSAQRLSKLLAARGGPDLILLTDHQMAIANQRGLLEPVTAANIPHLAELHDFARDPFGGGMCPAVVLLGTGLAYNRQQLPAAPKSWKVLQRRDLPAPVAFMDLSFSVAPSVLVHLAELNGGSINDIEPGLKVMAEMKERARFFKLFEVLDWINRGEVSVAPMLNIFVKNDPGVPLAFTFPDDGLIGVVNMGCIVKGAANKRNAEAFLDYYLSPEAQAQSARTFGETPVNKLARIPADIPYQIVPVERMSTMKFYDPQVIARNLPKWNELFQERVVAR